MPPLVLRFRCAIPRRIVELRAVLQPLAMALLFINPKIRIMDVCAMLPGALRAVLTILDTCVLRKYRVRAPLASSNRATLRSGVSYGVSTERTLRSDLRLVRLPRALSQCDRRGENLSQANSSRPTASARYDCDGWITRDASIFFGLSRLFDGVTRSPLVHQHSHRPAVGRDCDVLVAGPSPSLALCRRAMLLLKTLLSCAFG